MAWRRLGAKPLYEAMMTQFSELFSFPNRFRSYTRMHQTESMQLRLSVLIVNRIPWNNFYLNFFRNSISSLTKIHLKVICKKRSVCVNRVGHRAAVENIPKVFQYCGYDNGVTCDYQSEYLAHRLIMGDNGDESNSPNNFNPCNRITHCYLTWARSVIFLDRWNTACNNNHTDLNSQKWPHLYTLNSRMTHKLRQLLPEKLTQVFQ